MALLRCKELRALGRDDLKLKLKELKTELMHEYGLQTGGAPKNTGKIRALRKNIARVLTVMNEKVRRGT